MGISGIELCRRFYGEVVGSQVAVPHSAALIGRGSEVLGYDDEMSADHNCEARVVLFVEDPSASFDIPGEFLGRATALEVHTLADFFTAQLGFDPSAGLSVDDWLTMPEHALLPLTAGAVFHDDLGLQAVRDQLAYYPDDVWRYLLIAGWWRVHPEMNLVGRAGFVGDQLGSALIGSQLVGDLMRLCFLIERQYAPYSKWFGTAFSRLPCGPELSPVLRAVLRADTWQDRETALLAAYEAIAALHNLRGITEPVEVGIEQLWGRPFKVAWGDFPGALSAAITDPAVRALADRWPVGGIERLREVLWKPLDRRAVVSALR